MRGKTYDEINVGLKDGFSKTITESDIHSFSAFTSDFNPIHVDEVYATTSKLGQKTQGRIAQGMLSASLFSTIIGMYIPGKGALYVSQQCNFLKPVKIGDTLKVEGEVLEKLPKNRVRIMMRCYNQRGEVVVDGEAIAIAATRVEDVV
ncbi:MAG: MaoC family dehydratase [Spirochaetaceae bacterium]|jgi:3-hydroxybutyryl-CoA dehydratase|nr:MaoC family dehydratase [Spirochaetaceae bacterium]